MMWLPRGYGGTRTPPEEIKRECWRDQGLFAVSIHDHRLTWPERELIRKLGERLYGQRNEPKERRYA